MYFLKKYRKISILVIFLEIGDTFGRTLPVCLTKAWIIPLKSSRVRLVSSRVIHIYIYRVCSKFM